MRPPPPENLWGWSNPPYSSRARRASRQGAGTYTLTRRPGDTRAARHALRRQNGGEADEQGWEDPLGDW
jgi:hypothetical protein